MAAESFSLNALFHSPLGRLLYYLLTLICLEAGWGMCYSEWRARGKREYLNILLAFSALIISRGLALLTDVLSGGAPPAVMVATQMLVEMAALALLCWAMQFWLGEALLSHLYLSVNLAAAGLFYLILMISATFWRGVLPFPAWSDKVWLGWQGILCALAAYLILRRRHGETLLQGLALGLLAGGRFLDAFSSAGGALQLSDLVAIPLLLVSLYQGITGDLRSIAAEFKAISEPSSRQTRQLMFSLESARYAVTTLDMGMLLPRLAEIMALAVNADQCAIYLIDEDERQLSLDESPPADRPPTVLRVGAMYDPLRLGTPLPPRPFPLEEFAIFVRAIESRQQLHITPADGADTLMHLGQLLRQERLGDVLVQPLVLQDTPVGILVAANPIGLTPFGATEAKLCEGMSGQIAGAISNVRMYQSLQRQATQLAKLLEVQQIETSKTRAILESIADGVVVSDVAQQVMLIDRAAVRLLDLESETLLSETVTQLEGRLGSELRLPAGGEGFTFQSNPLGADGRIVRGSVAPVQLPTGRGIGTVIVFRDVTSELRAEQAKSDFLATVSHELRTPLTSIKGYSELLAGGMAGDLPGPMKRFLRMIATNADRMAHLVDNILYVSEAERGIIPINPRAVELADVVQEAVQAAAPAFAERDITCEVQLEPDLPLMDVDPPRLRQVLDNILQNAWKYTPAGGRVWVTARRCPEAGSAPSRSAGQQRDYVLIAVRDTGVGIRPEDRERIFERFYRSPNPLTVEAGGTGIGLTIVKSLVEAHGGRVWVDSIENAGSTFSIILPVQKEDQRLALRSRAA